MLIRERRLLLGCLIGIGLVTLWTVFFLIRSWNLGVPPSLLAAQSLAVVAGWLTLSIAWRALRDVRPKPRDPAWIALDLIAPAILLLVLATLWVEHRG